MYRTEPDNTFALITLTTHTCKNFFKILQDSSNSSTCALCSKCREFKDIKYEFSSFLWISQRFSTLGFRRPLAAKTLAGSLGGDQYGRINSSHSVIQEFARSNWMGLSGGDQSRRINSSHSIIQEFVRFVCSDWMGGYQTCQNNFPACQNNFHTC